MSAPMKSRSAAVIPALLVLWAAAGLANAGAFIMGNRPSAMGIAATVLAVCGWLVAAWLTGARAERGFMRFAAIFWGVLVLLTPVVFWVLSAAPGMSALRGGLVLPLLLAVLMAPLYGLYALLPLGEPLFQGTLGALAVLVSTWALYSTGRRTGVSGARVESDG